MEFERGPHGTNVIVLVRRRDAEEGDDLFAERLVHEPAVPTHDINRGGADVGEDLIEIAGVELLDQ